MKEFKVRTASTSSFHRLFSHPRSSFLLFVEQLLLSTPDSKWDMHKPSITLRAKYVYLLSRSFTPVGPPADSDACHSFVQIRALRRASTEVLERVHPYLRRRLDWSDQFDGTSSCEAISRSILSFEIEALLIATVFSPSARCSTPSDPP